MKEKDEEEKLCIDDHLCVNECHSCYNNLICEKKKKIEKGRNLELKKRKKMKEKQEE